jgi:multimeric flavodoxin WrbA
MRLGHYSYKFPNVYFSAKHIQTGGNYMHILALIGSRNSQGQTARATDALLRGAQQAGATTESIYLTHGDYEQCRQCDDQGWGDCRKEGTCVSDDEFNATVEKIAESDAVVFSTPVYWGDLSESMRAFTDRLRRICIHENGKAKVRDKKAIAISVAGGGGGGAPNCSLTFDRVLRTTGFDLVDVVPVRRQNLDAKIELLELEGKCLVEGKL